MIIIGYQGIGKSTLAKEHSKFIDLESGNFFVGGKRQDDWYVIYCQIAIHLSEQGKIVCVSSHKLVRDYLLSLPSTEKIGAIVPSIELKDKWIEKLKNRYEQSQLDKDFKAWKNAEDRYTENIKEILADIENTVVIDDMNYSLLDIALRLNKS